MAHELYSLILAAGSSQRLGQPKQLLKYNESTLIRQVVDTADRVTPGCVTVVLGYEASEIQSNLSDLPCRTVVNTDWQKGIGHSLKFGITRIPEQAAVLVLLTDQYRLSLVDLDTLKATWQSNPSKVVCAAYQHIVGVPAIFPPGWRTSLAQIDNNAGAGKLLNKHQGQINSVSIANAQFDVDTAEDLLEYQAYLKAH